MSSGPSDADLKTPPLFEPGMWNATLEVFSLAKMLVCLAFGGWGLFWLNDNGEATQKCWNLVGGALPVYDKPPSA